MKERLILAAVALLTMILIPTGKAQGQKEPTKMKPAVLYIEDPAEDSAEDAELPSQEQTSIRLLHDGTVAQYPEEAYLAAVVLCEMPPDFESEALKAQAVAARTFAYKQMQHGKHENADVCADPGCCQAWMDEAALRKKYKDRYDEVYEKAMTAIRETVGEVLTYGGELIDATYFSCSGGSTEAAAEVWGSEVPYLQPVSSPGEEAAPRFFSQVIVDAETFRKTIEAATTQAKLTGRPESWIGEIQATPGGGVGTMQIGGVEFSGTQLRKLFGLNSTSFTVSVSQEGFTFDVRGFGHRVGMSQYGADNMAKQGFDYRSILLYYYQGVKIEKSLPHCCETGSAFLIRTGSEQTSE